MNITLRRTTRRILVGAAVAAVALMLLISRFADGNDSGVPTQVVTSPPAATASESAAAPAAAPTVAPTEPAIADPGHNDGPGPAHSRDPVPGPAEQPPVLARPDDPTVREAATAFTAAWLNTYAKTAQQWRADLADQVTADLAADLADADPASVPTGRVGSPINISSDGSLWDAAVPVLDQPAGKQIGTLTLTLVGDGDRWLVSEIDWTPR
jgi:hypothetical protein